jgi:hypothetical protein
MIRILLPLAVVAAILFGPLYSETVTGSESGARVDTLSGHYYVGDTLKCWWGDGFFKEAKFSLEDDCEPKAGMSGKLIFYAVVAGFVAALLGVVGLLPGVGRLVSFVTLGAGAVIVGAVGFFAVTHLGGEDGNSLQWGSYLAGGLGLLTLISGLSGVRGR